MSCRTASSATIRRWDVRNCSAKIGFAAEGAWLMHVVLARPTCPLISTDSLAKGPARWFAAAVLCLQHSLSRPLMTVKRLVFAYGSFPRSPFLLPSASPSFRPDRISSFHPRCVLAIAQQTRDAMSSGLLYSSPCMLKEVKRLQPAYRSRPRRRAMPRPKEVRFAMPGTF